MIFSRNLQLTGLVFAGVGALIVACSSEDSKFQDEKVGNPSFTGDGGFGSADGSGIDLYANDPLPAWCGPDAGQQPPPITGSEECPDDKNKPGCFCPNVGEKKPCWTGLRKQRNLGSCKDGETTCTLGSETESQWGPCVGEVLPVVNAKGADACSCFSAGQWKIKNVNPCLSKQGDHAYATSTVLDGDKITNCYEGGTPNPSEGVAPPGIWSTSTLKVDCAGTYKLVYRIRAGDFKNPKADDCILGEVSLDATYTEANVVQDLPALPTWAGADSACAHKWYIDTPTTQSPGYGEMIVRGKTVQCNEVDDGSGNDFVFNRISYCSTACIANPSDPACGECQSGGTGVF